MMSDAINHARRIHRASIEAAYDGLCRIYEMRSIMDQETKVTSQAEALTQDNIPCHLSYSGAMPAVERGTVTTVTQTIKLFLAPEYNILPGSRIEVTQQGRTESYGQSGKPAVYSSHQEISLTLWKGYT